MPTNTVTPLLPIDTLMKFDGLETIITGILAFYIFLRVLSIIRISRDIYARTNSVFMQLISILLVTFLSPIIGWAQNPTQEETQAALHFRSQFIDAGLDDLEYLVAHLQ